MRQDWAVIAEKRIPELLLEYTGAEFSGVRETGPWSRPDLTFRSENLVFIAEVKSSGRLDAVDAAIAQLRRWAGSFKGAQPLLVVPYMGVVGAKRSQESGINYLDLSGNAHIDIPPIYVHVQGRPNQFPLRGRPNTPFGRRGSRLTRVMLNEPTKRWTQLELANRTGLSKGSVSKVLATLEGGLLVQVVEGLVSPRDPTKLLEAWAADYDISRHRQVMVHIPARSTDQLVEVVNDELQSSGVRFAWTGLSAAWLMDHFASYRLASVYLDTPPDRFIQALGARPVERGANLLLLQANDVGIFDGSQVVGKYPCVAPVQVYLDLGGMPERAHEAATELRSRHLQWGAADGS